MSFLAYIHLFFLRKGHVKFTLRNSSYASFLSLTIWLNGIFVCNLMRMLSLPLYVFNNAFISLLLRDFVGMQLFFNMNDFLHRKVFIYVLPKLHVKKNPKHLIQENIVLISSSILNSSTPNLYLIPLEFLVLI